MTRIIPPSHRSITGSLPTRFPARQLHYESKLERDFLILLEIDAGLELVETQPPVGGALVVVTAYRS